MTPFVPAYCAVQYRLCLTNHLSGVVASQLWILQSLAILASPPSKTAGNNPDWETARNKTVLVSLLLVAVRGKISPSLSQREPSPLLHPREFDIEIIFLEINISYVRRNSGHQRISEIINLFSVSPGTSLGKTQMLSMFHLAPGWGNHNFILCSNWGLTHTNHAPPGTSPSVIARDLICLLMRAS